MKKENIYDLIKEFREKKGISQRDLANLIGVHHSIISRIENGEIKEPKITILIKISQVLNIELADMLLFYGYIEKENGRI